MPTSRKSPAKARRTSAKPPEAQPTPVIVQEVPEPLNFLDVLSEALFGVSLYFLLYRILTVFIITNVYGYQWEIRTDFGVIPVLAFQLQQEQFAEMNSISQVLTSGLIFLGFLFAIFRPYRRLELPTWDFVTYKLGNVTGWWFGVIMAMLMFFFSLYLNDALRFEIDNYPGFIIVALNLLALLIYLIAYPIIRRPREEELPIEAEGIGGVEILRKRKGKHTRLD